MNGQKISHERPKRKKMDQKRLIPNRAETNPSGISNPIASAVSITQKQSNERGNNWSITINNPTEEEKVIWQKATENHWVKEAIGQLEKGESGTLHIQGLLKTQQVRFSQVKKLFPRAHIEIARNVAALAKYVQKDETRVAELPQQQLQQVAVMTPRSLQNQMASVVYNLFTHKGFSIHHKKRQISTLVGEHEFWEAEVQYDEPQLMWHEMAPLIEKNAAFIRAHADTIIDEAVGTLIKNGVFGAEYATANMACRQALKRYLVEILIRNANQEADEWKALCEETRRKKADVQEEID